MIKNYRVKVVEVIHEYPQCFGLHEIGGHTTCLQCEHEYDCEYITKHPPSEVTRLTLEANR